MDAGEISEALSKCNYPFVWGLEKLKVTCKGSILDCLRKSASEVDGVKDLWYEHKSQEWTRMASFVLHLALGFELGTKEDWAGSLGEMEVCLKWCRSEDYVAKKYNKGFMNVVNPCMAHVHLKMQDVDKAREYIELVEEMDKLSKKDQSAVWGLKAYFFLEYGEEGWALATGFIEKALDLDSSESLWHFLVGKLEFRKRHLSYYSIDFKIGPSTKELKAFQKAHALCPTFQTALFLAQSLLEQASSSRDRHHSAYRQAFDLFKEANRRYDESGAYSPHTLIRLGTGFRKLPKYMGARDLAIRILLLCLREAPKNAMVHHQLGIVYKSERQISKALSHFKTASEECCFPATLGYIELANDSGHSREALAKEYAWAEETYVEPSQRSRLHAHAASYHLNITRDLGQIVHHVSKAIQFNQKGTDLRTYSCHWSEFRPVDLIGSSKRLLSQRQDWNADGMKEDVERIQAFRLTNYDQERVATEESDLPMPFLDKLSNLSIGKD